MQKPPELGEQISRYRREIVENYPDIWSRIINEWKVPGLDDRAWLMYSANYLFRTGNTRWALDPLMLQWRLPEARPVETSRDLEGTSFILLTHRHADHLDLDLIRALSWQPILWVIPEFLYKTAVENGLPPKQIIVPKPLETLEIEGVRITPFDGLHWERDVAYPVGRRGVPAIGYLVEFSSKRWLFPGDVRTFDVSKMPDFGTVDGLFAHLWLGRSGALLKKPPLLEVFCKFFLDLQPKRIVLTHINEFGRTAADLWHEGHAAQVMDWFRSQDPDVSVETACMGDRVEL